MDGPSWTCKIKRSPSPEALAEFINDKEIQPQHIIAIRYISSALILFYWELDAS